MRSYITNPKELNLLDRDQIFETGKDLHGCPIPAIVSDPDKDVTQAQANIDKSKKRHARMNQWLDACSIDEKQFFQAAKYELCVRTECWRFHEWHDCFLDCDDFWREMSNIREEWRKAERQ